MIDLLALAYTMFWVLFPFIAFPVGLVWYGRRVNATHQADMHARSFAKRYIPDSGLVTQPKPTCRMFRRLWDGK